MADLVGGILGRIGGYAGTAGAGVTESVKAELDLIKAKTDTITAGGSTSSADYTASGAIAQGDLVGVTSGGKAAKITPDWAASAVPTTFTTLATGAAATTQSHSCWIATDKFITVYNNNANIFVVVSTIAADGTITVGTPVDTTYDSTANTTPVRVVKLDTDKAQIFYIVVTSGYGNSAVITVSGTVPTIAAAAQWTANEIPTSIDAIQLGVDKCCASYKITGTVYHHINGCTVSGTTQTWGTAANSGNTSSVAAGQSSIAKVATDLVAWFYIMGTGTGGLYCANVSFSGANPTRNGTDLALTSTISAMGDANGELTSCSPMANVAFVAVVNSSATIVQTGTVTVTGTAAPVEGVGTNLVFTANPDAAANPSCCSSQIIDATHIAVSGQVGNYSYYYGVFEVVSVNLVRMLCAGIILSETLDNATQYNVWLLVQSSGKSVLIVNNGSATGVVNLVRARTFSIYYKGLSTYADTVPTPTYGFLGIALAAINDAASGAIGLKGTFTGYASGLNVLKKYVRGTDEYTSVKTVNKDYPYGEVLATVISPTSLEVMIPPGSSDSTAGYVAFEYQPSLSGNGPWLSITVAAIDTFSTWTSYLTPHNTDLFVKGLSCITQPMNTAEVYLDVVQIGYGITTVNVTLLESLPVAYQSLSAVGLYPALNFKLDNLRVPAGQTIYARYVRYGTTDITTETVKIALTLAQLP